ncbi:MAG: response regulator transcription factor [Actinobacteria bacterium]|nr:MAG: response regulator transcription factor [Actinomycetota bacterium]
MEAAAAHTKIKVLIADDHRLFVDALEAILATDERFEVVGRAYDGETAVRLAGKEKPDVVLMDIAMPGVDGVEATRRIRKRRKSTAVLVLTGSNARGDVDRARKAGAGAYVTKDQIASQLIDAILDLAA